MTLSTPYTCIQCPCSDESAIPAGSDPTAPGDVGDDDEERTFDPRAPRSKYSLYPLEHLLYCEDCQQIRCPRCVNEEIVTYYCPNCLFEVPSNSLRSEGTRCNRSCYQCPICIGPLQAVPIPSNNNSNANLLVAENNPSAPAGPFALLCQHCHWSSSEVGIEFDRASGISSQLAKMKVGGQSKLTARDVKERRKEQPDAPPVPDEDVDADLQFSALKSFYSSQLSDVSASLSGLSVSEGIGFSSPANLSRLMSLYKGRAQSSRSQQGPADVMREPLHTEEGLKVAQLDESAAIKKLHSVGWDETASQEQREAQQQLDTVRFQDHLRPIPYLLRTKRSKRCPVCRHIISKPEAKVSSTRFKIRLVAKSYIPSISIRPLRSTAPSVPVTYRPQAPEELALRPFKPVQYILTFKNPLFEKIKVTLAAPNNTPGRFSSKVTVLCPQFEIDANTDMWDDALREDGRERNRRDNGAGGAGQGGEAGKIWDRGRNWVSIVLEVIPSSLRVDTLGFPGETGIDRSPLREDEDILEVPMFVRMEWEADTQNDMGTGTAGRDRDAREKRELAYWCVLGVGRISQD